MITIHIFLQPSLNSRCTIMHQIKRRRLRSNFRISIIYHLGLNYCRMIWPGSKLTRIPRTILCIISRIEAVDSRYHHKNSQLTAMFLLMAFMQRDRNWSILKYIIKTMMTTSLTRRFLLTYNSVTEWVATLIPMMSHWRHAIVIS